MAQSGTLDEQAAVIAALTADIDALLADIAPLVAQRDALQRAFDLAVEQDTGKKKP